MHMIRTTRTAARPLRLVAAMAVGALLLAACNGDDNGVEIDDNGDDVGEEPDDDDEAAEGDRPDFLTLATGSTGGTYFPLGGAMAGVWNDNIDDLRVSTQSSGASVDNLQLLDAGEVELIMAVNGVAADAMAGEGDFEEALDFAFLGNIYGEVMQVVAGAGSGIESIADMEGATVAIGPPGSGTEVIARQMLEAAGLDPDSDIDARQESFGDAADGLRDGQIDAVFAILALPAGSIEDVATGTDLTFVSIDDDLVQTLLDGDETLSELVVEPDTYPGQDEEVTWVTNWATLYAPSDLHEDVVYDLVRVLYEENETIAEAHDVGSQIQIDTALDGRAGIPIHPGAQRYFDEVGAEDDANGNGVDDDDDDDEEDEDA
jgi:uncharacterized protein